MVDAEGQRGKILDLMQSGTPLRIVGGCGWTADEIDSYIGWRLTTAGRRLGELRDDGLVEPCGERPTRGGRPAPVYRITS